VIGFAIFQCKKDATDPLLTGKKKKAYITNIKNSTKNKHLRCQTNYGFEKNTKVKEVYILQNVKFSLLIMLV